MERKLIFWDIGGTLTKPGENVPPSTAVEAVKRARGHRATLCSGRNLGMLAPLLWYRGQTGRRPLDGILRSWGALVRSLPPEREVCLSVRHCGNSQIWQLVKNMV